MYNNNSQYSNVTEELSRLHLTHVTPQQYSPSGGKKIGPVVPPKPKKPGGQHHSQMQLRGLAISLEISLLSSS
ncbi:hypothetical protein SK128_005872 [Halocaridina rubra]|uniref:Uncharacterized protein n=1 Tax=Halocaridina rubra TaxID=373956 RepID=A0AAN9AG21_HALRR